MRPRYPEAKACLPVMLVHGEADPMVPSARMVQAKESLEAVGFKIKSHLRPGLGHGSFVVFVNKVSVAKEMQP